MKITNSLVSLGIIISSCTNIEKKNFNHSNSATAKKELNPLTKDSSNQIDEFKIIPMDVSMLPKEIKYQGKIKQVLRWHDKLGVNIVITSETGGYHNPKIHHENDGTDAEVFAYHYLVTKNQIIKSWRVHDFIYDCPVDYDATFLDNTFQLTDLNKNGIGEIWLMYKTVCHGDVSPYEMKIILYEGKTKYAMRGQNKVEVSPGEFHGGEFKFDKNFSDGPKEFKDFAKNLWNKNIMQS